MTTTPTEIKHSTQRKYTIVHGACKDHAGDVSVNPLPSFDLDTTIFTTLEGKIPRLFISAKLAKTVQWNGDVQSHIDSAYTELRKTFEVPTLDEALLDFMQNECDLSAEHADGSFMEHLVYGYEYGLRHYPERSALVLLLHSIMGTATNTFAMDFSKMEQLRALVSEFEFKHISAFPSFLRLMYEPSFFQSILDNKDNLDQLKGIRFHRVIDNQEMELNVEDLWIQLNYHLVHFVDFLPVANWQTHRSDPLIQTFIQLSEFLDAVSKRQAQVDFPIPADNFQKPNNEKLSMGSHLSNWIPASLKMTLATKSIRKFSEKIGHSLTFELLF
jgi:hypothetical protein